MHIFLFTILWLVLTAALLSLAWHLFCAGRWLYRWLRPWNEAVDARAREYLVKPHPLWTEDTAMAQRREAWAMGSPGGSCLKEGKTVVLPPETGKRRITVAHIKADSSDALGADSMMGPPPLSWPSARNIMPTSPAGQQSPSADQQGVSTGGDPTPAQDA